MDTPNNNQKMADHGNDNYPPTLIMKERDSDNDSDDEKYLNDGKDSCN